MRANTISPEAEQQISTLQAQLLSVSSDLAKARERKQLPTDEFAQGKDIYTIVFDLQYTRASQKNGHRVEEEATWRSTISKSWDELFGHLGPTMLTPAPTSKLDSELDDWIDWEVKSDKRRRPWDFDSYDRLRTTADAIDDITLQCYALGVTEDIAPTREDKHEPSWTLTSLGRRQLV